MYLVFYGGLEAVTSDRVTAIAVNEHFLFQWTDPEPAGLDRATLDRVLEINRLQPKDREMVLTFLDAFLTRTRLRGILQ